MISAIQTSIYSLIKPFVWFIFTIGIMATLYWSLVRFIAMYCAPDGFYGLIATAFTMGSPFCQAITQILVKISEYYLVLWTSIVTGFVTWFITTLNINTGKSKDE